MSEGSPGNAASHHQDGFGRHTGKSALYRRIGDGAVGRVHYAGRAVAAHAEIGLPPFPKDLDLSSVERLHKSAAYRMEVKAKGAPDAAYRETFVFETRNDWVLRDYFNADPARRGDVITADLCGPAQGCCLSPCCAGVPG